MCYAPTTCKKIVKMILSHVLISTKIAGLPCENVPQEPELHWVLDVTLPCESPIRIQCRISFMRGKMPSTKNQGGQLHIKSKENHFVKEGGEAKTSG